jgi:XTP/dITP diphosphohydrolase
MTADCARLVLASRNRKKCLEIRALLEPVGIRLSGLDEFGELSEVVEDGATFAENAAKKAGETARALGRWTLGEDSGLCVDALSGAPGVFSARYSGPGATDASNNEALIEALAAVPEERRTARYVCHVALADPTGAIRLQVEACCRGRITTEPFGHEGFGYDPYFLIPEYHRTFAQLGLLVKRELSHRSRAFRRLLPGLRALVCETPEPA